jgi:acetyl-CoA carboxylase biotin carboxyl carrier protein
VSLSSREIKEVLAILEDSGWDEAQVTVGDVTLSVSKGGNAANGGPTTAPSPAAPPAPTPAAAAPTPAPPAPTAVAASAPVAAAPAASAAGSVVEAPSVGVFWRSPEPGAPPFVDVGAAVAAGDTLCIVEVMKLMQHIVADTAGTVTAIHAENGDQVEFGTPLFTVDAG